MRKVYNVTERDEVPREKLKVPKILRILSLNVNLQYDDLSRLTEAEYIDDSNEVFTMDDLGNRSNVNDRSGTDVSYTASNITNRYSAIGGSNTPAYDEAGNLETDKDNYDYTYDYENRIVTIKDTNDVQIAAYQYDALGRRIGKVDSVASETTYFYYGRATCKTLRNATGQSCR